MTFDASANLTGRQPKAVQSALRVLEEVARAGSGVTAKEVARSLALPQATTYRLINLLVGEGYLVRLPNLSGFALGRKIGIFVDAASAPVVCGAARDVLEELRMQVRFGVHLAYFSGTGSLRFVDADPDFPPGDEHLVNQCMHGSALGKLLLAEESDLQGILPDRGLHRATRFTISNLTELLAQLDQVQAQGFAKQVEELREDCACLAVPIRDRRGRLTAGLSVSTAKEKEHLLDRQVDLLRTFADRLGPLLS
ncbi:DNA-binding IclR family transcriptional regulator [Rhodococcus sp. 27YEA15]|uniref:IclR family transcriptional regulator n=1 Tax=Rhodococcus sp. 27YEA15 TaxID=3156259 RepID=UPI003C7E1B97